MKLLLDENFPLPLFHELRAAGSSVEHIIVLGQRGLPDAVIRKRLASEELIISVDIPCPAKPSDPAARRYLVEGHPGFSDTQTERKAL